MVEEFEVDVKELMNGGMEGWHWSGIDGWKGVDDNLKGERLVGDIETSRRHRWGQDGDDDGNDDGRLEFGTDAELTEEDRWPRTTSRISRRLQGSIGLQGFADFVELRLQHLVDDGI